MADEAPKSARRGGALFMEKLREFDDRVLAARAIGQTWKEVKRWIDASPKLQEQFADWQAEMVLRCEDGLARKGASGDSAAAGKYLAANDPRFRKGDGGGDEEFQTSAKDREAFLEALRGKPVLTASLDDSKREPDA